MKAHILNGGYMEEEKQTTEVREVAGIDNGEAVRRQSVERRAATSGAVVFQRVIWYITGFIVALLLLRIVLQLLGANNDAGFVEFVYGLSNIFASPFYGIFNYQPVYGASYLEVSTVVGVLVYLLVGWGIAKLATLTRPSQEI